MVRVVARRHDRPPGGHERVLERGADAVDPSAAALAHPLRAERRERRRRLDRGRLERRHVQRVRDVVVVEVRRQQVAVVVVGEHLEHRRADRLRGRAHHLALDDLRVDPHAAVVHRRVVDDLVHAGLRIDLDDAGVDLHRVRQRQVAELLLLVRHVELRAEHESGVHRGRVDREAGVVHVGDRPECHERQRRLVVLLHPRKALGELDVVDRALEDHGRERSHLVGEVLDRALHRAEPGDRELARVRSGEAGMRVPVVVVSRPDLDDVHVAAQDVRRDLRRGRLVALPLGNGAERDDDLSEEVELRRRHLVVPGELELRVQ